MVDYVVHYSTGDSENYEGESCFGALKDQANKREWDLPDDTEAEGINYVGGYMPPLFREWLKGNKLFGHLIDINHYSKQENYTDIWVEANAPADQVLGALSLARLLCDENRESERETIEEIYEATGDLDLSIWLTDMADDSSMEKGYMFRYREESLVAPFNIKKFMDFLKNPLCNGGGIEENYSLKMTYESVKTAVTGKVIHKNDWATCKITRPQVVDFLRFEGYLNDI